MKNSTMEKAAKKVEVAANVGIIIVALLTIAIWGGSRWLHLAELHHDIPIGSKLALNNVNWPANGKSIVLALSTTCHFCTESAGFYRELAKECKKQNVRTIAVLPQPVNESKLYLADEGVSVDEVIQARLPDIRVVGTPTLLLVDGRAEVKAAWYGKLPGDREKEVLTDLSR